MSSLFDNDPVYAAGAVVKSEYRRNSRGQFCTPEQQRIDRIERENKVLRAKSERYYRAWQAAVKELSGYKRKHL